MVVTDPRSGATAVPILLPRMLQMKRMKTCLNFHDSAEVEGVVVETEYSEPKGRTFSEMKDHPHFRLVVTFRLRNGFESGSSQLEELRWWQLKGVFPGLLVDGAASQSKFLEGERQF